MMFVAMNPHTWMILGPIAALSAVLLALTALGLEPALRALAAPEWPPSAFRFSARLIHPALFLALLLLIGAAGVLLGVLSGRVWVLLLTPLTVMTTSWLTLRIARAY